MLLTVVLSAFALVFLAGKGGQIPAFAAHPKASDPHSIFAFAHRHGTPAAGGTVAVASGMKFSCTGSSNDSRGINATEKVVNDSDSGQAGNYWALDAFTRTIQVWN